MEQAKAHFPRAGAGGRNGYGVARPATHADYT